MSVGLCAIAIRSKSANPISAGGEVEGTARGGFVNGAGRAAGAEGEIGGEERDHGFVDVVVEGAGELGPEEGLETAGLEEIAVRACGHDLISNVKGQMSNVETGVPRQAGGCII